MLEALVICLRKVSIIYLIAIVGSILLTVIHRLNVWLDFNVLLVTHMLWLTEAKTSVGMSHGTHTVTDLFRSLHQQFFQSLLNAFVGSGMHE